MVCVLALTLAMSVCAFAADTVTEDEAANYKSAAETLISQIAGFSDEEIENYLAQDDAFTTATMESWKSVKDELGAYSSIVSQDVEKDGDVVTISTVAQFEKAKADVVLMLDLGQQMYTSMTYTDSFFKAFQNTASRTRNCPLCGWSANSAVFKRKTVLPFRRRKV